ncbi:MAG: BNR-4 repeat-containing protein [Spirochaetales bacterium]|nr:BNR-4 repeat-containing protein [Spirochaetales bacterium]
MSFFFRPIIILGFIAIIGLLIMACQTTFPPAFLQMPQEGQGPFGADNGELAHFSALAFDSQNRPYGLNAKEDWGYFRTLRQGQWEQRSFRSFLKNLHPQDRVTTAHQDNGHQQPRLSITSDDHLYLTYNYLVNDEPHWALIYLDDLDTENFQIIPFPGARQAVVEEFTGFNLLNGETPAITVDYVGESFSDLGWPEPTVSWTVGNVNVVDVVFPFRRDDGKIELNSFRLGNKLGAPTIHSGGNATMATRGNLSFVAYSGYDEEKALAGVRKDANIAYLAQITRPETITGQASMVTRSMGIQSVYQHLDSHSQGSVVIDAQNFLHFFPGNHAAADFHMRSRFPLEGNEFDFSGDQQWENLGLTTPKGDFSYDTVVVDQENTLHFAYRQRNAGKGRGLFVKSAPATVNKWDQTLGQRLIAPPPPWDENGEYIIFYHRLLIDRLGNLHLSGSFLEFEHYEKGRYPRLGLIRSQENGEWQEASLELYRQNLLVN